MTNSRRQPVAFEDRAIFQGVTLPRNIVKTLSNVSKNMGSPKSKIVATALKMYFDTDLIKQFIKAEEIKPVPAIVTKGDIDPANIMNQ